mgnify:CR=1 FL=1
MNWHLQFGSTINILLDIKQKRNAVFRWACVNGSLESAIWFSNISDINILEKNFYVLKKACHSNQLKIVIWLLSIFYDPKSIVSALSNKIFKQNKKDVYWYVIIT